MWWTAATGMLPAPVTESLFAPRRALTFVKYPDPEQQKWGLRGATAGLRSRRRGAPFAPMLSLMSITFGATVESGPPQPEVSSHEQLQFRGLGPVPG